jgi:hypothetical protein
MKFGAKIKKFDAYNIKTFEEIYKDIKNNCIILKDINDLV